jgi:hypothetical protein
VSANERTEHLPPVEFALGVQLRLLLVQYGNSVANASGVLAVGSSQTP